MCKFTTEATRTQTRVEGFEQEETGITEEDG
jgi:hypothetical protein